MRRVRFCMRERERHRRTSQQRARHALRCAPHLRQRLARYAPATHRTTSDANEGFTNTSHDTPHAPRGNSSFLRSSLNFAIFVLLLHSLVRVPFSACLLRDFFMGAQCTRLHLRKLCNDACHLPVR